MKTDYSISINVNLGATPELLALVGAIVSAGTTPTMAAPVAAPSAAIVAAIDKQPTPPVGTEAKQEAEAEPTQAASSSEPAPPTVIPTLADMRTAMDEVRRRIEGEDYSVNKTSPGYVKYHKNLTAMFKNLAAQHGADKPSELDDKGRAGFIVACALICLGEDGNLMYDTESPF